ncbi:unnamed protein product [Schistosoma margrebowiei]|uniref:Uncharacterized protein n=1 Tax=Schistosoma margrebowiei TaxID=48269 RepID=A0A3P8EH83_9TREM|nr:unnamed protein product [Schistosoma margrebowiei]
MDSGFALFGTRQQGVPIILRELVLPDRFDPASSSFTARNVINGISGLQLTSCRSKMYSQLIDH